MNLLSISEITGKAKLAIGRFPLTSIWAIAGSFYCIYLLENANYDFPDKHFNTVMTLILGVSWFIGAQFFIEQQKNIKNWLVLKIIVLALLIGFFFYLPQEQHYDTNPEYLIRFFLFFIAGHLFVLVAPFIAKWEKNAYWNYLKTIAISILRSGFFSGILYLGLALALAAIDALFDVNISSKRYGQTFIFCLGIVNTLVYLSDFPKNIHAQIQIHFQKALEVLVKYILIPLIILYLAILYAYSFKILIDWELPKGWVSYLVIALALLGFLIQVIINPIQKDIRSWTINKFYPFFYVLLLPLIALLFVAIFRRITDYGITENRYFVLVIAIWILAICLYLLFSKIKSLKVLPISLFSIAILASFGFWGAIGVSKKSQTNQFKELYTKALNQNKVLSQDDLNRLKDILDYLEERKTISKLNEITGLNIESFRDTINSEYQDKGWLNTTKIWDTLAIKIDSTTIEDSYKDDTYFSYYLNWNTTFLTPVEGYDMFRTISLNNDETIKADNTDFYTKYDGEKTQISFYNTTNDSLITILDLKSEFKKISHLGHNLNKVAREKLTITYESKVLSFKIIPNEFSFRKENDSIYVNYMTGFLFSKKH